MSELIYIDPSKPPDITADVAVCPICGEGLYISEITEYFEDGTVEYTGLGIDCVSMPSFDSSDWWDWFNWHYSMPYVDWLPLQVYLAKWFNERYRIGIDLVGFET